MLMLQATGEMSGEDGLGSQSYVPFSLPKDPDTADDTTKYVSYHSYPLSLHTLATFHH